MKFSIITAVYNRRDTVGDAIASLRMQTYPNYEHVIVDGASSDGTLDIVKNHSDHRTLLISEPDDGIYDALNKGMARSSGDIIGLLHSDDLFASPNVLAQVASAFNAYEVDAVYGDLQYVSAQDPGKVIRHWRSGSYDPVRLSRGWMPPHPALFIRRNVYERFGGYDTSYKIAADYEAILRWFASGGMWARHVPDVLVHMRVGGVSNRSLSNIICKSREDYRAMRTNKVGGLKTLAWKNLSKVGQFIVRERTT